MDIGDYKIGNKVRKHIILDVNENDSFKNYG